MAFSVETTLNWVLSYIGATARFDHIQIGDFKAPPQNEYSAAIMMSSISVAELTLSSTTESHVVLIRLYHSMLVDPTSEAEIGLAQRVQEITSALLADFDLGETIRNIDAGGQHGTGLNARWGHVEISGATFRIVDMFLPLIVNDGAVTTR